MSKIFDKTLDKMGINKHDFQFHIEEFQSAMEVAKLNNSREITDSNFNDMRDESFYEDDWRGVKSYEEAEKLLMYGHQPTVDRMRTEFKADVKGDSKRFSFRNDIVGAAPVVPLAMKGIPNCMVNSYMKPIKAKVVDIYYDMTDSARVDSDDIIKAGQVLLGTILELERQGYRFNVYCTQCYNDGTTCDMLVVKVKDATQPIDLKRMSFPLAHTGFFRCIGFDWYSRFPGAKYRRGYGHKLSSDFAQEHIDKVYKMLFGKSAVVLSGALIRSEGKEHVKEVLSNANSKN